MKTIGFFGDSFAQCVKNLHSEEYEYTTYIARLIDYYKLDLVHLGQPGSSVWDAYLNQLKPFIDKNEIPDICVFAWTQPNRMFHKKIRNINAWTSIHEAHTTNNELWTAAKGYYEHLWDADQRDLEYKSFLYYLDNVVFSQFPKHVKIIHLWSFGNVENFNTDYFAPKKLWYSHTWSHGVEIRPALMNIVFENVTIDDWENRGLYPNHLNGTNKNNEVFRWVRQAIENYSDGLLLNKR